MRPLGCLISEFDIWMIYVLLWSFLDYFHYEFATVFTSIKLNIRVFYILFTLDLFYEYLDLKLQKHIYEQGLTMNV